MPTLITDWNLTRRRCFILLIIGLLFIGALALSGCRTTDAPDLEGSSRTEVTSPTQCIQTDDTIEPSLPWRFMKDTDDIGVSGQWFDPTFDDSEWAVSTPGKEWSPEYVGVAWYRVTFTPPASWETAYLGISDVNDKAQLWIDGVLSDWNPENRPTDMIVTLPTGRPVQLTLRVTNVAGIGGITAPVQVSQTTQSALPPERYLSWLSAQHPSWPMPGWVDNGYYAWTFTGIPDSVNRALVDAEGTIAPWATAPSVSLWTYDSQGSLSTPNPVFSLVDRFLPIPQAHWQAAGLDFLATLFAKTSGDAVYWQVNVANNTNEVQDVKLLSVVKPVAIMRPVTMAEGLRPVHAAAFDQQGRLWLNDQPFMETTSTPTQSGVGTLVEVQEAAQTGSVPAAQDLACAAHGDAAAASVFVVHLAPGETYQLSMIFPSAAGDPFPDLDTAGVLEETRRFWQAAIGTAQVVTPDSEVNNAYQASSAYLMLSLTPKGPRPGPLAHAKLWARDASIIGDALLQLGQGAHVKAYLPLLFEHQEDNGRIPPIVDDNGPTTINEWDSQGEAIHLVAALYRYEGDKSLLERWEPNIKRAAEFIRVLRAKTQDDSPATRGLLPPSNSAEDLGPDYWHHYWDDLWAVTGLEEAAFIESELGHVEDAQWMRSEANELHQAILTSVEQVMGADPAYIPGAPEDLTSSAMARGTSVSLFPVEIFSRDDPLIVRSFETYYEKWIKQSAGGYTHAYAHFWPYGGLDLARDYLRLGRQDIVHQILGWTLQHQTLPGTYAWAEQVSRDNGGIRAGDMPHAWAAASMVSLVREMLVISHADHLELFAGVPESWLAAGKAVSVHDIPTEFGTLTALTESDLKISDAAWQGTLKLTISGTAQPPAGFTWKLLQPPTWVEGPPGTVRDGCLVVPGSGGTVKLGYNVPPDTPRSAQ